MTPSGIEPATFRFVAQHLNHCATAVPPINRQHHQLYGCVWLSLNAILQHISLNKPSKTLFMCQRCSLNRCLETTDPWKTQHKNTEDLVFHKCSFDLWEIILYLLACMAPQYSTKHGICPMCILGTYAIFISTVISHNYTGLKIVYKFYQQNIMKGVHLMTTINTVTSYYCMDVRALRGTEYFLKQ